ncbi:MAG: HEPN domain-containing protein, partial [Bacteroidia bacterium]
MKKNDDHANWIQFAESDLELAKVGRVSKKILYETLCYHCQQSCEKSIKAALILNKIIFPKTHDLEFLINLAKKDKIA